MFALNKHTGNMDLVNDPNTKIIKVSKDAGVGGFSSIKETMDSITDSSSTNPYCIELAPGHYYEDTITMKKCVSISGCGGPDVTRVYPKAQVTTLFDFKSTSPRMLNRFQGISIHDYDTSNRAVLINVANEGTLYIDNIKIYGCKIGVLVNHADAMIYVNDAMVSGNMTNAIEDVIKITAGYVAIRGFHTTPGSRITNLYTCTGSDSELNANNCLVDSHIIDPKVVTGFNLSDGTKVIATSCDIENTDIGVKIDNASISARNCIFHNSINYDISLENGAEFHGHGVGLNRDKIYNDGTGILQSYGCDCSSDVFRSLMDFSVGLPSVGRSCFFGKGGPYENGVKAVTFDGGTTYADVTDSTEIEFPNLVAGTCIYFGELNKHTWYGLQYLMGDTKISGGTIEWQYYDETAGWIKVNTLNTIDGYSDSYNGNSFLGDDGITQSIRFDYNIKEGIIESDASATGWANTTIDDDEAKWIRCMITSDITTSPKFQLIRFKSSYKIIRTNGTTAFNGQARSLRNIMLPFGDSGSGGVSIPLGISTNITYPFWNNGLNDGATQELYFRFVITEDVDTSSGLQLKYKVSTAYNGVADKTAKVKVHFSKVKSDESFDGTNAETTQDSDFVYTANEDANLSHTVTLAEREDISDLTEDDMVFCMIQRSGTHGDDDLTDSIDFSSIWVEYRVWQDGKNNK